MVRKLHLRESNEYGYDFLGNAQDRVRDENRVRSVYNLDKRAYELYKLAELNTDIIHSNNPRKAEIGYKAYWDLAQYLRNNNMDETVLYDLAADFRWDSGLDNACKRFDKQYGKKNYVKFNGVLFDPTDGWTEIYDTIINGANNNTVQKLDDKYGNYPNVRKAIDVYYAGTYYTEPMDYSRT